MLIYVFEWSISVYMNVLMSICAHMCEMSTKHTCLCVHIYMQTGVYVALIDYEHVYTCVYMS